MRELLAIVLILVIVGAVLAGVIGEAIGAIQLKMTQAEAQRAQAEAAKIEAQYDLAKAQADLEIAEGHRQILEEAAEAIKSDRQLVEYYSLRNDIRTLLILASLLGLAVSGIVITILVRRQNAQQYKPEQQ